MKRKCEEYSPITKNKLKVNSLLDDELGVEPSETVMNVPHDLVPKVRETS